METSTIGHRQAQEGRQARSLKGRIERRLEDSRVAEGVQNVLGQLLALRQVDHLNRAIVPSVSEKQDFKIGARRVSVNAALLNRDRGIGLNIDCQSFHLRTPFFAGESSDCLGVWKWSVK